MNHKINIREFEKKGESASSILIKSSYILEKAHISCSSLLHAFDEIESEKIKIEGLYQGQDLLRAILVFASAGLDSMIKHLIRDSLPVLLPLDEKVKDGLENFAIRQLKKEGDNNSDGNLNYKFLARILIADSLKDQLIQEYIGFLTGSSLQSADELVRATYSLGLEVKDIGIDVSRLKTIFSDRNKIIHELDILQGEIGLIQKIRPRDDFVKDCNYLLEIGQNFLSQISSKIKEPK